MMNRSHIEYGGYATNTTASVVRTTVSLEIQELQESCGASDQFVWTHMEPSASTFEGGRAPEWCDHAYRHKLHATHRLGFEPLIPELVTLGMSGLILLTSSLWVIGKGSEAMQQVLWSHTCNDTGL